MGVINKTTDEINNLLDKVENMPEEGVVGKTPVLETGTTSTLPAGSQATSRVVRNGSDSSGNPKYKINFGIPQGMPGSGSGGGVADSIDWKNVINKPTWVQSATKPSYTATEVGALPASTIIPIKTSQLTNDSGFVKNTGLKTINGESIVGEGNIEITGSGGGIAEAPTDGKTYGRKNKNWVAIGSSANSADITTIYNELSQQAEVGGVASDDTYNKLLNYNKNGYNLYIVQDGYRVNITSIVSGGDVVLSASIPYFTLGVIFQTTRIDGANKNVSVVQNLLPSSTGVLEVNLEGYSKAGSYSAIKSTDSIKNAIAKLEAGIGGSSGGNTYYIAKEVLKLSYKSTSEEIFAAFGNENIMKEISDAINNKSNIVINSTSTTVVCSAYTLLGAIFYLSFIKITGTTLEIWSIKVSKSSSELKILYPQGYEISSKINTLTNESTSADIENALGGFEGIKKLEKAVADGNSIYTTYVDTNVKSRLQLSVVVGVDDSNYRVIITGTSGDGYMALSPIGILLITYEVGSNTYSCLRYTIQVNI